MEAYPHPSTESPHRQGYAAPTRNSRTARRPPTAQRRRELRHKQGQNCPCFPGQRPRHRRELRHKQGQNCPCCPGPAAPAQAGHVDRTALSHSPAGAGIRRRATEAGNRRNCKPRARGGTPAVANAGTRSPTSAPQERGYPDDVIIKAVKVVISPLKRGPPRLCTITPGHKGPYPPSGATTAARTGIPRSGADYENWSNRPAPHGAGIHPEKRK